jgi:hypothetical protein
MGKRFKEKPCAYCDGVGVTADHVFARNFFPVEDRANLPQVAACECCNHMKSELEHYVLSVLPFGGHHPSSNAILEAEVPRRLNRNRKLHRELVNGKRDITMQHGRQTRQSMTIPFDSAKLSRLFEYVAKGLVQHHWQARVPSDYFVGAGFLRSTAEPHFEQLMMLPSRAEARGNLGRGLILYQGIQTLQNPLTTLWRFQLYGGAQFGGDPNAQTQLPSNIWASTSRNPMPGLSDSG